MFILPLPYIYFFNFVHCCWNGVTYSAGVNLHLPYLKVLLLKRTMSVPMIAINLTLDPP